MVWTSSKNGERDAGSVVAILTDVGKDWSF